VTGQREYGLVAPEIAAKLTGLELLQGIIDGHYPSPPIMQTLGFQLVAIQKGKAVFEGTPEFRHYNPIGSVHGGWIATILDSCMACAAHSMLEASQAYTTLEFKISFIRGLTEKTGAVRAVGEVLNVGRRAGTAEASLFDGGGKLLAHGTTTCLVMELAPQLSAR
jgi:uncharacterized protein (TIGR00369 family)